MAKQVFDNKDLVNLIYGFGPEHRERMIHMCFSIKERKVLLTPVPNAMRFHLDWFKYVQFFRMKRCHCCSRHCYRKPNILLEEGMVVFVAGDKSNVPEAKNKHDCDCDCRHECRMIIKRLS